MNTKLFLNWVNKHNYYKKLINFYFTKSKSRCFSLIWEFYAIFKVEFCRNLANIAFLLNLWPWLFLYWKNKTALDTILSKLIYGDRKAGQMWHIWRLLKFACVHFWIWRLFELRLRSHIWYHKMVHFLSFFSFQIFEV